MAVTKAKKAEVLQQLDAKFAKAKAVYFGNFTGLTVKKSVNLRKKLLGANIDYVVAKKTLYRISLKNNNLPEVPAELMKGPVGAVFSYEDTILPAKLMHEFTKDLEAKFEVLGGLVDGRYIGKAEAKALALLPSREELLAKLVGSMKSPIVGFHSALSGVLRKFVYTMAAVRDKKEGSAS